MLKKLGLTTFIALLFIQLSACGFHLRGTGSVGALPFSTVKIDAQSNVDIALLQAIERQFSLAGVKVQKASSEVQLVLQPTKHRVSRTSTSGLGDATSELIKMSQAYQVIDALSGDVIITDEAVVFRDRQINTEEILASENELRSIKKMMRDDLARQIMQRIQRTLQSNKSK